MAENIDQTVGEDGEETPEVEAHTANVLDLQAMKVLQDASDGNCFSLISYVNSAETSAS
ncbi:hypothetical protein P3T27_007437 [Kitasatospora sp. MAA19]|uniref:hypothetical protein n=1 Tax=Kitasatospora sp. MAA19 TaxID=3035090 RepID=UPI00247711EB|nr:hypothetical protein [Kitasatospora sp. MAA19]MDH6710687.1 hypothetical protein [Kitasatospora sp. MAA19]